MAKRRIIPIKSNHIRYNPVIGYFPFILINQVSSDAMSPTENANDTAQNAGADTAGQGPPLDLPDAVPDFVSDLLATISESASSSGETMSETASSANPADVAAVAADVAAVVPL